MRPAELDYFSGKAFAGVVPAEGRIPVACVPGYLCSPAMFMRIEPHIARRLPVQFLPVSWMAWRDTDLEQCCDRLIEQIRNNLPGAVIVAGHSGGGPLALLLALRAPELVAGLVLAGTGPNFQGHLEADQLRRRLAQLRLWDTALLTEYFASCFAAPADDDLIDHLVWYAQQIGLAHAISVLDALIAADLEADLAEITAPAAIIHGRADPARPLQGAQALAHGIAHTCLYLSDCGHTPMVEDPATFADAVQWTVRAANLDFPGVVELGG